MRRPARSDRALPARRGMPCASVPPGRAAGARAGLRAGVPTSSSFPRAALRGVLRSFRVLPAASSFFGVWGSLGSRRLRSTGSSTFCSQRRFCDPCRYKISVLPTCPAAAHDNESQIVSSMAIRAARSSPATRTLISPCAVRFMSISFNTAGVRP